MATCEDHLEASKMDCHDALEKLGCSKTQSEKRIKIYNLVAENSTLLCRRTPRRNIDVHVLIPGSRGEGTGLWADSDIDMLFVERCVNCSNNYTSLGGTSDAPMKFLLDFENVEIGYVMLRLISIAHNRTDNNFIWKVKNALVQRNGYQYLRNDQIFTSAACHHREGVAKQQFVFDDTTGPARKIICELPFLDNLTIDRVLAFPCSYPTVLDAWYNRERKNGWPTEDLMNNAKDQDVFVVPVGLKGSDNEVLQWRISVTFAEQALVHSFNDTQIKLFTAMKMLAKHELNPVCDNISSYVVKNITFWMFEETGSEHFTRENFIKRLIQLLERLKKCVFWRYLPNYMFPSRNMLTSKIFERQRIELILRLDSMIEEGPCVLLRVPLVKEMVDLPQELSRNKVMFMELAEQVTIAMFCIPSSHFRLLMDQNIIHNRAFLQAKKKLVKLVVNYVIPLIRIYNPHGYFNHLNTMSNGEIVWRLFEGVMFYVKSHKPSSV